MRRCLRDLVALSMLSAVWSRSEPKRIAQDLADVVCRSVSARFVYVSLRHTLDVAPWTVLSTPAGSASSEQRRELTAIVEAFLQRRTHDVVSTLPNPFGPGALSIAVTAIGLDSEYGVIVTASAHDDFPRPPERLLLDVAANQAAVVVQHARSNAALRTSEAHFRSMADNAPALLWVSDATGACTYLSKQWYEFTGRTPQDGSTIGCFDNVHPDDVHHALDVFRTANTDRRPVQR